MSHIINVSTQGIHTREQFDFWQSVINGRGIALSLDKQNNNGFHANIKAIQLGTCTVSHINAAPNSALRTKSHISQDRDIYYLIYLPLNSDLVIQADNQTYCVKVGEIALYNTEFPANAHQGARNTVSLKIPKSALPDIPSTQAVKVLSINHPKLRFLRHCIMQNASQVLNQNCVRFVESEVELNQAVSDCFSFKNFEASRSKVKAFLFQEIQNFLFHNSHNPISISEIAKAVGISEPYVFKVLAYHNTTFRHLLTEHRLRNVIKRLDTYQNINLAHLATECGFKNQSHMSTSFSQRFAMSPKKFSLNFTN